MYLPPPLSFSLSHVGDRDPSVGVPPPPPALRSPWQSKAHLDRSHHLPHLPHPHNGVRRLHRLQCKFPTQTPRMYVCTQFLKLMGIAFSWCMSVADTLHTAHAHCNPLYLGPYKEGGIELFRFGWRPCVVYCFMDNSLPLPPLSPPRFYIRSLFGTQRTCHYSAAFVTLTRSLASSLGAATCVLATPASS